MNTLKRWIVLVLAFSLAGCSTVGKYQNPAVSQAKQDSDRDSCKQTGMRVGGYTAGAIGILFVPIGLVLAIPGFIMAAKAGDIEQKCLETRGYTKPGEEVKQEA